MKSKQARAFGKRIAARLSAGEVEAAYALLAPVLAERTPFAKLDLIGEAVGACPVPSVNSFLEHIAAHKTEGGWVVMGKALAQQCQRDLPGALKRCQKYIVVASVWYAADILGERVPGPLLVTNFEPTLELIAPWREHDDAWVRRTVGVAVHFWAKRSRGTPKLAPRAKALLDFLEPMFAEQEISAVKGIGWGLKTLGKYYPDLVAAWLSQQLITGERQHRALMLRKALTYLSEGQRRSVLGSAC